MATPENCSRKLTSMGDVLLQQPRSSPGSRRSSAVHTQARLEKEDVEYQNARMRQHWDKAACQELGTSDRYQKVAVLIVRWVKALDQDLKCWEEVDELDRLFRNDFGYDCKVVALDNRRKRPQAQFNSAMSSFVLEHDGPFRNNLLLVYYSGHGYCKEIDGVDELFIAGTQEPQSADTNNMTYPAEVRWDKGETALEDTEADVLTIMDCCFASNIMKGVTDPPTRTYETLAATGHNLTTPKPGKRSYTRALIDSLKEELHRFEDNEQRPFDTFQLNQRIKQRQNWSHLPQLFQRNHCSKSRHIRLAPLDKTAVPPQPEVICSGTLDLRLVFSKKSDMRNPEITKLATKLAKAARKSELGITALDWVGFTPKFRTTQFRNLLRSIFVLKGAMTKFRLKRQKRQREDDSEDPPPSKRLQISVQGPEDFSASPAPLTPSVSSRAGTEDP